jgi:glutaminyl-peptide cyclotransferase
MIKLNLNLIFLAVFIISCSKKVEPFSWNESKKHLEKQVSFGPRNPGSAGHELTKEYIINTLKSYNLDVNTQNFKWYDERFNKEYNLTNIIASLFKEEKKRVLISCHWDTNPISEKEKVDSLKKLPIPGANDGASGVAMLLELARILSISDQPNIGIDLVFFDGEDLGSKKAPDNYCIGSKKFAEIAKGKYHPYYAINVDMIAGKKPLFKMEQYSFYKSKTIATKVWDYASNSEFKQFFSNDLGDAVYDDHLPLINIGIAAINIIDYNMLNDSNRHHTQNDNLEHIHYDGIKAVANVLIDVIYGE